MENDLKPPHISAQDLVLSLRNKIFGQDSAIHTIGITLQSIPLFEKKISPLASFLLVGKNGVGKKRLVESLAELLYGRDDALIHIAHQTTPSSFLDLLVRTNSNEKKYLYEAVKSNPNRIIFLEDINEKFDDIKFLNDLFSHPAFEKSIIIISTTLGADVFSNTSHSVAPKHAALDLMQLVLNENNLSSNNRLKDDVQEKLFVTLKNYFPTNILRQLQLVPFNHLDHSSIERIFQHKLKQLADTLEFKFEVELQYAPEVLRHLMHLADKQIDDAQSIDKLFANAVYPVIAHVLFANISKSLQKRKLYLSMHSSGQLLKSEFVTTQRSPEYSA